MQRALWRMEPGELARKQQALKRLDTLAKLLDSAFVIPGTTMRMGLAGIIGFVPGIGDVIGGAISSYIVWEARRLGVPRWLLARMMFNVMIETGVGVVPVLGDMFDIVFKANLKNLAILKRHLERQGITTAGVTIDGTFRRATD